MLDFISKRTMQNVKKKKNFSDGVASHYRKKKNFIILCKHKTDFGIEAEWDRVFVLAWQHVQI
jgi:hypothetical protein